MANRILVVDDDLQNVNLIKSVLDEKYLVKTCINGLEALQLLPDFKPDVILLDWNMPVLNGLETLQAIKAKEETKHIQVIMITGYMTEQSDLLVAYNAGVIDFIRKPFDVLELKARVNSVVQLSEAHREQLLMKDRELMVSAMRLVENSQLIRSVIGQLETISNSCPESPDLLVKIQEIITQLMSKVSDSQWKRFETSFSNVNPVFNENLLLKHPELTPAEIKLCTLIKLSLSSKQISAITFSTVDSIKVARARLRKKLGIDSEANLTSYLMGI